ncbi:MAG TPA: glycosyltransferase family 39 protein [Pirellulales bacterium]|jgi:hypothetical protein|nr:glycosyltransferase family 39 protein [Pirellulales bacterium]
MIHGIAQRLADARSPAGHVSWRWPVGLLILCLTIRMVMAARIAYVCDDGAFFIERAAQLAHGAAHEPDTYDSNCYVLLLVALEQLGLDRVDTAKYWGVLAGSLAVLPIFGWVRRQFSDAFARMVGVLYATHPRLIESSAEVMRDSTYWLLFALSLYLFWRALAELRSVFFILAGAALGLAINTRLEALYLLVVLVGWAGVRVLATDRRTALLSGALLSAVVATAMITALTLAPSLMGQPVEQPYAVKAVTRWWYARLAAPQDAVAAPLAAPPPVAQIQREATTASAPPPPSAVVVSADAAAETDDLPDLARGKSRKPSWLTAHILERGFTPFFGILVLVGLAVYAKPLWRRDIVPLYLLSAISIVGIWCYAKSFGQVSCRYVMPLVIVAGPSAIYGLRAISRLPLPRAWRDVATVRTARARVFAGVLMWTAGVGVLDAWTSGFADRAQRAELGLWLRDTLGPGRSVVGTTSLRTLGYYAEAAYHVLPINASDLPVAELAECVRQHDPDVAVFPAVDCTGARRDVAEAIERLGLVRVDNHSLPDASRRRTVVFTSPRYRAQWANRTVR